MLLCVLPPSPRAGWLSARAQRLVLAICGGLCREPTMKVGDVWVRCTERWKASVGQRGAPRAKRTQPLVSRLPRGVHEMVGGTYVPLSSEPWLLCSSLSRPLSHADHLSTPDGVGTKGHFLQCPTQQGKSGSRPPASHFPPWEILQARGLSLGTELCRPGRGVTQGR